MGESAQLRAARDAAQAAGELIEKYYRQDLDVRLKSDRSPVTDADIAAENCIREVLSGAFPDYGFLGEETGASGAGAEYTWLVDPIDGTKSFVRRYPFFSTQIALMHREELLLGVSSAPIFGEVAWAERGGGAFIDGIPIKVSEIADLGSCALSSGNLGSLARSGRWASYGRLVAQVDRIRGYGDFYHYHLLASGRIDAVLESDVNILDIAALAVIVEEAGGRFTDLDGAPVGLATTSVLASNGYLHGPVADCLGA